MTDTIAKTPEPLYNDHVVIALEDLQQFLVECDVDRQRYTNLVLVLIDALSGTGGGLDQIRDWLNQNFSEYRPYISPEMRRKFITEVSGIFDAAILIRTGQLKPSPTYWTSPRRQVDSTKK